MREILFRGIRKLTKEWIFGSLHIEKFTDDEEYLCCEICQCDVLSETVGQYTGLTDKNGKRIFEGDIMPVYELGEEYYYKVVYNGDCFMLAMLDSEQGSYPLSAKNAISEVIGNIHDNPELLKGAIICKRQTTRQLSGS